MSSRVDASSSRDDAQTDVKAVESAASSAAAMKSSPSKHQEPTKAKAAKKTVESKQLHTPLHTPTAVHASTPKSLVVKKMNGKDTNGHEKQVDQQQSSDTAATAAASSTSTSTSSASSAAIGELTDGRPSEEVTITNKRTSTITDEEIHGMLFPSTNESSTTTTPAKIESLRVVQNRCSLLPSSVNQLTDLQSLKIQSNSFEFMMCDENVASQPPNQNPSLLRNDSETETKESDQSQALIQSPSSRRSNNNGLRDMPNLQTLEFIHSSSPPLSSSHLPSSLTSLSIQNYDIAADQNFFNAQLSNLQNLSLSHIRSLTQLPDSVNLLTKLETLSITHNPYLTSIPTGLVDLPSLTSLNLSNNSLHSLPETLDQLLTLKHLDCSNNRLIVLPRVFTALRDRGCEVRHDQMMIEDWTGREDDDPQPVRRQSSILIEEIKDMELSSPSTSNASMSQAAAASSSSTSISHSAKRKKDREPNESDQETRSKHPRASAEQSAASSARTKHERHDEEEEEDEIDETESIAPTPTQNELELAANAAASAPQRRAPASKRKMGASNDADETSTAVVFDPTQNSAHMKKIKIDPAIAASYKYFHGELDYADRITTNFIDPGRKSSLFASADDVSSLTMEDVYKLPTNTGEREIVLLDEQRDVRLQYITKQARLMLKQTSPTPALTAASSATTLPPPTRTTDELQLQVRLLACLVSDSFGGRVVVFSPQLSPFSGQGVYDASRRSRNEMEGTQTPSPSPTSSANLAASSSSSTSLSTRQPPPSFLSPLASLQALCHTEVNWWKANSHTNVVLLCSIQHGLCRHRSILMKYLVDTLFQASDVECKLVRGYREGGVGHAWNVIRIRGGAEYILDCLDSPHLFRPISSLIDPSFSYYPQFAISSSTAFATRTGETQLTLASFRDLHLARQGRLLGEGSYSHVYECFFPEDAASSQPCALKISPISHLTTPQFAALLKEIRILPHLRHTNIVQFYGYIITSQELKCFMELVRGRNLDTIIKVLRRENIRLSLDDILVIFREIARGLQYLHENSTLHRDLKSAQILIGHPELSGEAQSQPFTMPVAHSLTLNGKSKGTAKTDRPQFKAKRKFVPTTDENESAAAATAAAASSAPHHSIIDLSPRLPNSLSFFSDASIKLCDFNIAASIFESHEDADSADAHLPKVEYVGTLRWCACEVFRASVPGWKEPEETGDMQASPTPVESLASRRLRSGKLSDIWSLSMILLELLSLHLPYENVPTEADLNAKLIRGERSDYHSWLDARYWNVDEDETKMQSNAIEMWRDAVAAASDSSAVASLSTSFLTPESVYSALVGLYIVGTSPKPSDRPTTDVLMQTLDFLFRQRMHALVKPTAAGAATTTPTAAASSSSPSSSTAPVAMTDAKSLPMEKLKRKFSQDEGSAETTANKLSKAETSPRIRPVPVE